jgi:2'-hydroxyisoflavone reductase
MKLLILGGTIFLGRHVAEGALARGHSVTLFNRGTRDISFGKGEARVERLKGDRYADLSALDGGRWDAVVDTCGFIPSAVRASAERLAGAVSHYTFVSSGSVFDPIAFPDYDETAPVGAIDGAALAAVEARVRAEGASQATLGEAYGALKALCESAAEAAMPGHVLNVRAGLIVGPFDRSDRFTYWVRRLARAGDVLAPAPSGQPVQLVDVRDLAAWIVRMAEERRAGVYSATGPAARMSFGAMLEASARALDTRPRFVWADERFLLEQGVAPWKGLPLWLLQDDPAMRYMLTADCKRAIAAGLTFRPLAETVRATREWDTERGEPPLQAGLAAEREQEILAAWRARGSAAS